ncbi:MAG: hypothetical protein ABIG63_20220 [Chloroflexota bacterium]
MKKLTHSRIVFVLVGLVVALLAGCLPTQQPADTPSLDAVFTSAAETIVAQYTADAAANPPAIEPPTVTLTAPALVEPTHPPEPTSPPTLEPTITSTLAPTETSMPTTTSIPEAIFEDDFSDTSVWYTVQEDDYGFEYADNGYHISNDILNGAIWSLREIAFADVRLDVDVTRKAGPADGYFGVVCRFSGDGTDYYALVIGDDGFYGILKMDDGELEFLESGTDNAGIIQRGQGETNRVSGVCSGDLLTVYANDQQLLEVWDDTFSSGDIGLVAGNKLTGAGVDVLFDNFAIFRP